MNSWACARRAACSISSTRGVGLGVGDVLGDGRGEQERVVADDRDGLAQRAQVDLAHVGAVEQDRARELGSYSREISETRLVLPEPVAPTSATVRPAGTSRSMSLSTARAGAAPARRRSMSASPA